ncbi:relaxase/mobilization nuclease domain-containing protein [Anaerocolumna xylanovorans]|uniref:Relaxase/Mobilisation nuclease domain-containing protein n=1 Tax=Anaerocolumna xylanovorans DSM 12503 TaxID=1121345 RepID=A0A1M7Y8I0_9FIRM|nr:relaxase/mobilization nuclease domain-containing protein [Anaerocolumna xylanovorans]SHO48927.1 Relaxase/Mobilisation nuclease domain-containing protein [Anaerocolumna xylanovorans DSM 12503]
MPNLIVRERSYSNLYAVEYVVGYILDPLKCFSGLYSGIGVDLYDTKAVIDHFNLIKRIRKEGDTKKKVRHLVLSFDPDKEDYITPEQAFQIAFTIAQYFGARFQIVFGIHDEGYYRQNGNLHVHFAINTLSYIDGSRFPGERYIFNDLIKELRRNSDLVWDMYFT